MSLVETPLAGAAYAIRHGNTSWTVERELTLRRLWAAGWSAGEINLQLGGTTRNAVIGKLHRFGLTKGDRTEGVEIKCLPGARTAGAKVQRRPDGFRRKALPKNPQGRPPVHAYTEPAPIVTIERSDVACTFAELSKGMCRYPYGEPGAPDFAFCGRHADGTYCAGHRRIAYRRPTR